MDKGNAPGGKGLCVFAGATSSAKRPKNTDPHIWKDAFVAAPDSPAEPFQPLRTFEVSMRAIGSCMPLEDDRSDIEGLEPRVHHDVPFATFAIHFE